MAIELTGLTDQQIKRFLHQVRSRDLMAYLEQTDYDNQERIQAFLSERSRGLLEQNKARKNSGTEGMKRCEELLEEIISQRKPCLFCCIIEGKTPGEFVYRGDEISVIMDLYPMHPGHMLVLPHQHADSLEDLDPRIFAKMGEAAQEWGNALMKTSLKPDGFNLMIAQGAAAGQELFHPHMHIIPRYHGDGLGMKFPEGYPAKRNADKLKKEAREIAAVLQKV